jgi:hypothetical protein
MTMVISFEFTNHVGISRENMMRAEFFGHSQTGTAEVRCRNHAGPLSQGKLYMQQAGYAAAEYEHTCPRLYPRRPLAAYNAGQRLDKCTFFIRYLIREQPSATRHINCRQPDIFTETARIEMRSTQKGVADRFVPVPAVAAVKTWHMMSCNNPVSFMKSGNTFSHPGHPAGYFMTENKRRPFYAIPFHGVAAADGTGKNLHQEFSRPYLRDRHFLEPDVPVIVVHSYTHKI